MRAHTGHSDDPITEDAIGEVIAQIESDLAGADPKAAVLFCSVDYEHQTILQAVHERWPGLPLIGGTSDGEMSSKVGFCHDSVLLTVLSGDGLKATSGVGRNLSNNIEGAVAEAIAGMDLDQPTLCLTMPASSTDTSAVLEALSGQLGQANCPVLGGLSGDHRTFENSYEFFGTEVSQDSLPLLFIEGDLNVSWGTGSGWTGTGREMTITKSEGNAVHTIDHIPALEVFEKHYGVMPSAFLGEFPLSCRDADGEWQLRACLSQHPDTGVLFFGGSVSEGSTVRFTEVLQDGVLKGSSDALEMALDRFEGEIPQLALVFSCAARKWVLGTEAAKEIDILRSVAEDRGAGAMAFAGLYCYGEIAPSGTKASNALHNETCATVVLG